MQKKLTAAFLRKPAKLLQRHDGTQAQTFFCELPEK